MLFSIFTELCNIPIYFSTFHHPKKKPHILSSHLPFLSLSSHRQIQIYFLSLWICLFWTVHTNGINTWPSASGFLLLNIMFSWFIHMYHISGFNYFLRPNNTPLYKYTILCVSIHQWWTFDLVHFLAIMNNAAMNIHVQVFIWTCVFNYLGYMPRSRTAGSYCNSMFNTLRNYQTFFQSGCTILQSHQQSMRLQFLPNLTNICYWPPFLLKPSKWVWSSISVGFFFFFDVDHF